MKPAKMTLYDDNTFTFECQECGICGNAFACKHFNANDCEHIDARTKDKANER